MATEIERDDLCFCCGKANTRGLRMTIGYPEPGAAETSLVIPEWFSGWRGITHGGFLSTVLDEIMAHACVSASARAMTGELAIRYLKPVPVGTRVRVVGSVKETRGRIMGTEGKVYDESGAVVAEASARFIRR